MPAKAFSYSSWLRQPSRSDWGVGAAYWLIAGTVLLLEYGREFGWARALPDVLATVVLDSVTVAVLTYGLLPGLLAPGQRGRALALVPGFILLSGAAYLATLALVFGQPVGWTGLSLLYAAVFHAKSYGLLAVVLTAKHYHEAQQRLLSLQKAQAESELRNLKAQVDPHFLFNNLHVLHVLIGQDADVAAHYLNCFAGLYRYLIRHRDADFVPLADELRFLDEYVYLLRHRFGAAYAFQTTLAPDADPASLYAVPGTLQILLENAIKHNRGDEDDPLLIILDVQATALRVRNFRRPKRLVGEPGGTGLPNLQERYRLLAGQHVLIHATDEEFSVTVPLLRQTPRRPATPEIPTPLATPEPAAT